MKIEREKKRSSVEFHLVNQIGCFSLWNPTEDFHNFFLFRFVFFVSLLYWFEFLETNVDWIISITKKNEKKFVDQWNSYRIFVVVVSSNIYCEKLNFIFHLFPIHSIRFLEPVDFRILMHGHKMNNYHFGYYFGHDQMKKKKKEKSIQFWKGLKMHDLHSNGSFMLRININVNRPFMKNKWIHKWNVYNWK